MIDFRAGRRGTIHSDFAGDASLVSACSSSKSDHIHQSMTARRGSSIAGDVFGSMDRSSGDLGSPFGDSRPAGGEGARRRVAPEWGDGDPYLFKEGGVAERGHEEEEEEEVDDWVSESDGERDLLAENQDDEREEEDVERGGGVAVGLVEHGGAGDGELDESVEGDLGIKKEAGRKNVKLESDDDENEQMSEEEEVEES